MTRADAASPSPRRPSILVADGWAIVREPLALRLRKAGYEVVEAGSATAALQLLAAATFDAAVLDRTIRDKPTDDVADKLAALGIPFVFLTGARPTESTWGWHEEVEELRKPAFLKPIMAAVERLFDRPNDAASAALLTEEG